MQTDHASVRIFFSASFRRIPRAEIRGLGVDRRCLCSNM
jgi:hypothetical protein